MTRKKTRKTHHKEPAPTPGASPPASASGEDRTGETQRSPLPGATNGIFGAGSRRNTLAVLALGLLVAVSYFPTTQAGFVWDDMVFTEEPVVHKASGLWQIWFSPRDLKQEGHYWPLVYTTFWLEHKLWGLAPLGYHIVNVLLHFVNVLLVWRLLLRLAVPGAWAIAAVFAVHPLHVESVAWVIERKDLLSALFYLTAVLTWLRFVEAPQWGRYVLTLALFVAGLLSKSVVVTLPAALLIGHWWQQGRLISTDLWRLAPFFLVALTITVADVAFYRTIEILSLDYSLIERVLIAARALWFYAGKLLWPTGLAVIYPLWDIRIGDPLAWAYVVAAVAVAALLWFSRDRLGRGPLAGALFFAVTLSPVLGFVDYGYMQFSFVADRYQYLAGLGVMAVLVGGAVHGASKLSGVLKMGATGLLVVVLAFLGTMTWHQAGIYRDSITFFNHITSLNPEARNAHLNLGGALLELDHLEEGLAATRIAVEQRPDSTNAHSNLGLALFKLNRLEEAEEQLRRVLDLNPRHRNAHQNLAETLRKQERYEEAIASYRAVLEIDPEFALAHASLGTALFELKRYEEAVEAMEKAVSLQLELPRARVALLHLFMGRAARELGRPEAAEELFRQVMALDPRNTEPLLELANLRVMQQRYEEADVYLRRARELRPRDPATFHTVAEALRKQNRYEEAIASYRAVLEIDPEFVLAHAGMGTALFELKRYEEAVEAMEKAVALQPELPVAGLLHRFMGIAWQEMGRPEVAAEQYERAVRIDPGDTEALDRLAMVRFGQKRYEEARTLYQTMIEINPDNARTHSNLGAALFYLNRLDEALGSFERALSLDPNLKSAQAGLEQVRAVLQQREE